MRHTDVYDAQTI